MTADNYGKGEKTGTHCPHCGHNRILKRNECSRCGKKNLGFETYKNKHGKERMRSIE